MGIPGYRVLVLIGWRILWQAVGSYLVLLFLANLALLSWLPELTRTGPSVWALLIPLLTVTVLVAFLIMPAIVRALLTRSFSGVRLQAIREGATPESTEPLMTTGSQKMKRLFIIVTVAVIFVLSPMAASGVRAQDDESVVSGTLVKLDLSTLRGMLTTDLGRPVFFDIPNAYLFENVTQGARITLRLDEQGGAVKVMDTSIADFVPAVISTSHVSAQPLAATLPETPSPIDSPQ